LAFTNSYCVILLPRTVDPVFNFTGLWVGQKSCYNSRLGIRSIHLSVLKVLLKQDT